MFVLMATVVFGVLVFVGAREFLRLPDLVNLVGAGLLSVAFFGFSIWVLQLIGLMQTGADIPEVHWYAWLVYFLMGLAWFVGSVKLMALLKESKSGRF